jgi:hypothetical protein
MRRRRAVPADIDFTRHRVAAGSITLPTNWSPEQAVAVFEILDELRDHVCPNVGHRTDPSPVRLHRPLRSN